MRILFSDEKLFDLFVVVQLVNEIVHCPAFECPHIDDAGSRKKYGGQDQARGGQLGGLSFEGGYHFDTFLQLDTVVTVRVGAGSHLVRTDSKVVDNVIQVK